MGAIEQIFPGILWDTVAQLRLHGCIPRDVPEKEKNEEKEDI